MVVAISAEEMFCDCRSKWSVVIKGLDGSKKHCLSIICLQTDERELME